MIVNDLWLQVSDEPRSSHDQIPGRRGMTAKRRHNLGKTSLPDIVGHEMISDPLLLPVIPLRVSLDEMDLVPSGGKGLG